MLTKVKEALKNRCGITIVEVALILLFIVLAVAPYIRALGETTGAGIQNLNSQMQEVLNNN